MISHWSNFVMLKVWKRGYVLYAARKMNDNISVDEPCDLNIFSYIFTVHSSDITFYLCLICFNSKILKMNFLNFILYVLYARAIPSTTGKLDGNIRNI
jgi:hypothetical protein